MKNILNRFSQIAPLILFLLLISLNLRAQTKEETIKWIEEKINKYGRNINTSQGNTETSTSEGTVIKHTRLSKIDGVDRTMGNSVFIILNAITNATPMSDKNGIPCIKLSSSLELICRYYDPGKDDDGKIANDPAEHFYFDYLYLNWDAEPDLLNRMTKAFTTLISFSRPKETF
jgi:hypothetical protein